MAFHMHSKAMFSFSFYFLQLGSSFHPVIIAKNYVYGKRNLTFEVGSSNLYNREVIKRFRDLEVYQESYQLMLVIHKTIKNLTAVCIIHSSQDIPPLLLAQIRQLPTPV